jgi:hypothetical protein
MSLRRSTLHVAVVAALVATAFGVQTAFTAPPSAPSSVVTIDPARILDTREPRGVPAIAKVPANSSITLQVTGAGGVPLNATGVILTLTAANASLPTFITATPTGTTRSTTSVLNPAGADAIANTITIALGTGGKIDLYNLAGTVDLIADVNGYLVPAGSGGIVTESIELQAYAGQGLNLGLAGTFGCVNLGTAGELFLDVPLPHGAAVQSVVYRWYDTSAVANLTVVMLEIGGGFPGTPTQGGLTNSQGSSTGAVGYGSTSLTISGGDAVSGSLRYMIDAFTLGTGGGGALHMFCGATVTYARVT